MNSYLSEIENEYSRLRGRASFLTPVDWQLAASWEEKRVPIHIVLRAMDDVSKKFQAQKRKDSINSLRYFKQEVEKQFAEWQTSRVGKYVDENTVWSDDDLKDLSNSSLNYAEENNMKTTIFYADEYIETLETLYEQFKKSELPEPLASAVLNVRRDLLLLAEEVRDKHLPVDDIEERLVELARGLEIPIIAATSDAERGEMITKINREYENRRIDDNLRAKILMRRLYTRYDLPELTLFEL